VGMDSETLGKARYHVTYGKIQDVLNPVMYYMTSICTFDSVLNCMVCGTAP
jgi:hypothetical protein